MCVQEGSPGSSIERAGLEGLGVVGVGAPGMVPAAAREPTAVVLQRKTSSLRSGVSAAASASYDSSSAAMSEAASVNQATGLPNHDAPVRRRPRVGDAAAAAVLHDASDIALSHFGVESGGIASMYEGYDISNVQSSGAGPQAFQLKWPLQPQPVNSAHSHLSNAAAKTSDRYSSAAGTSKPANLQFPGGAGIPAEGRRSSLSRRSDQGSAHSSTHSSELYASIQSDPFASRPLLAHDMMLSPTARV